MDKPKFTHKILETFGPLMGVSASLHHHQQAQLENLYSHAWSSPVPVREWLRSVTAALSLLQNGFDNHPAEIAPIVVSTIERQTLVQMELGHLGDAAWKSRWANSPDSRFRPLFDFYTCLYERWYPLLIAPFIVSDSLLRNRDQVSDLLHDDGRVSLNRVYRMEAAMSLPSGLLTAGLERHMRNSISHGRYVVLDSDRVQMEDRDPREKITWGPRTFVHSDAFSRVFRLSLTCEALLASFVLFDINNGRLIVERNFVGSQHRRRRLDVIEAHVRLFAQGVGLQLISCSATSEDSLNVSVSATGDRISSHEASIVEEGEGWSRRWVRRVHTEEAPLLDQLCRLMQDSWDLHAVFRVLRIHYVNADGEVLGSIEADYETRKLVRSGTTTVDEVASRFTADTIPRISIPVVLRDPPRET